MRTALERLGRETRKVIKRKLNRPACSNIRRERAQKFCRYHTHHKPLIKTAAAYPASHSTRKRDTMRGGALSKHLLNAHSI